MFEPIFEVAMLAARMHALRLEDLTFSFDRSVQHYCSNFPNDDLSLVFAMIMPMITGKVLEIQLVDDYHFFTQNRQRLIVTLVDKEVDLEIRDAGAKFLGVFGKDR